MEAIGYDLYTKLLEGTVRELTGRPLEEKIETSVEINIEAYIPSSYIEDENQKIEIYKKIAAIDSKEYLYDIEEEIEDRFGDIPGSVRNLLHISYIKHLASKFKNDKYAKAEMVIKIMDEYKHQLSFTASEEPYFILKMNMVKIDKYLKSIIEFLDSIVCINKENNKP